MNKWTAILFLTVSLGLEGHVSIAEDSPRVVQDSIGREVKISGTIRRVAPIGTVPIMSSFLLALGKGDTVITGIPGFTQTKRHKYLQLLLPSIRQQPVAQGPAGDPNLDLLTALHPDLIVTMDPSLTEAFQHAGWPCLVLQGRNLHELKSTMRVLGVAMDAQSLAARYIQYVDEIHAQVDKVLDTIPDEQRPRVLFLSLKSMGRTHHVVDWWIKSAGGRNVVKEGLEMVEQSYSMEQLTAWNPDILVVNTPAEIEQVYRDPRFLQMKAVETKRVYAVPMGIHTWHRSVEQPLMLLWAAKTFAPGLFRTIDLYAETKHFYHEFFDYELTDQQVTEMLTGE
jgi:iron complex transport system substrate-binding protein